jgi:hypothetical protein
MVEQMMYLAVGFLSAGLIAVIFVPIIHGRAVRLTERRLQSVTPLAAAEIQAKKDQLRAEFAMSARRVEQRVEELESRLTSLLAELGRKGDIINRLRIQLGQTIGETVDYAESAPLAPEHPFPDRAPARLLPAAQTGRAALGEYIMQHVLAKLFQNSGTAPQRTAPKQPRPDHSPARPLPTAQPSRVAHGVSLVKDVLARLFENSLFENFWTTPKRTAPRPTMAKRTMPRQPTLKQPTPKQPTPKRLAPARTLRDGGFDQPTHAAVSRGRPGPATYDRAQSAATTVEVRRQTEPARVRASVEPVDSREALEQLLGIARG